MRNRSHLLALGLVASVLAATPALAQSDIIGEWGARTHEDNPERGEGPDIGEFQGSSVNAANIARAETWSASILTVPEHQCFPHPADYQNNFTGVRILKDVDPLTQQTIAYQTNIGWMNPNRRIWMDGRPHPGPNALHTWEGFSTGKWEGDTLVVDTSHLKVGYIKRNGLVRSETAKVREYFTRTGEVLTWTVVVYDPRYLTEPMIRNRDFYMDPGYQVTVYPCSTDIEVVRAEGEIPHYLPGTNPDLREYAEEHNLPYEATRTGAESMYPEYQSKLTTGYQAPAQQRRGGGR